jgi:hypothetical protein
MGYLRVLSQYQASQFLANNAIRHLLNKEWHFLSKKNTLCTKHVGSGKHKCRMTNFVKARLRNYTRFTEQKSWYHYWQYHKISTANVHQHQSQKLNLKRGCIMFWNSKHNNPQCCMLHIYYNHSFQYHNTQHNQNSTAQILKPWNQIRTTK